MLLNIDIEQGYLCYHGKGAPRDQTEAVKWYRLAADQGVAEAQFELGWMYCHGKGVLKDHKEGIRWYWLAAELGLVKAQLGLANIYASDEHGLKDHIKAYAWFNLVSANGDYATKQAMAKVARQMTPEQISHGQKLSTELDKKINAAK